jgi:hypothetical protein
MITWPESVLPVVGVVDHCKFSVGAWAVMPSCVWLHAIEVLVTGRQGHCVGIVMSSLACRRCHVCVGRVVVSIF